MMLTPLFIIYFYYFDFIFMLLFISYTTNNYQKIVEKDFIYYNIIAIKWGESTHFPGQTGNRGETTRIPYMYIQITISRYSIHEHSEE